jgi:hypothetical protein
MKESSHKKRTQMFNEEDSKKRLVLDNVNKARIKKNSSFNDQNNLTLDLVNLKKVPSDELMESHSQRENEQHAK